jgi:hypothetical protein
MYALSGTLKMCMPVTFFNLLMVSGKVFLVPYMKINTKFKEIHAFPSVCDLVAVLCNDLWFDLLGQVSPKYLYF